MSYTKPNLKSKHYDNLFNSLPSLEGKTIAITGTTSGTGYVAANACGKLGAKVFNPKFASGILKKLLQLKDSQKAFDNNMFELEPDALLRKNTLKVVNLLAEFKKNRKKNA